jgi:site-specific DNA recombinase
VKRECRKASMRCAIYTRVSNENGLEQEFNSLDNQREASEAYIRSQAHEGWKLIRDRYDDGGFSGGSMDRPALAKLLDDVRARKIDVIVVYKVDRLTRSLADFAKLVELFDEHDVSFISVTQAFNTTTSMGRLTLNMLLSFAQFEREITGERIRDKVAASKKRGIWMGGAVPFGYRVENRALHIVEEHAKFVRDLFRRYLEVGSVVRLKILLDAEDLRLPVRIVGTGRATGGGLISRGHIYWILSNPIYVGRLRHKGQIHAGLHCAIVNQETWDRVQRQLAAQTQPRADPLIGIPNPSSLGSFTTIGAIGWARAMPPKADSVGATTFRGRSSKVASLTPDPSLASQRPRSRNRCSMGSKASSPPGAGPKDFARCLTLLRPGRREYRILR